MAKWRQPEIIGGFIGMLAAFAVGHWLNARFHIGPWVTGEMVCDTYNGLQACTGYMPLGVMLLAIPLVAIGAGAAQRVSRYAA